MKNNENASKTAAIVLNGETYTGQIVGDIVIGVDGGYNKTSKVDVFVGDNDSIEGSIDCGKKILLDVDKDATDGEYAIKYAIDNGYKNINFYGVTGGRLDHILTNLSIMAYAVQNGANAVAFCNDCDIYMVKNNLELSLPLGSIVSLSPFTDCVHIISLEGVKWELSCENIYKNSSRTISNVVTADKIRLCVDNGIVIFLVNK